MSDEHNHRVGEDLKLEHGKTLKSLNEKVLREKKKKENPPLKPKMIFGSQYKDPKKKLKKTIY